MLKAGGNDWRERLLNPKTAGIIIFVLAFAFRLVVICYQKSYEVPKQRNEMENLAYSLLHNGTFANAFGPATGPSAHCSPLYPMLLSVVFRFFGSGVQARFVELVLSAAFASAQYGFLPSVAAACEFPSFVGIAAGLFAALVPLDFWVQTTGTWEYSLSAALTIVICWAILRVWRDAAFSWRTGLGIGILGGLNLLTTPQMLFVLAAVLVYPWVTFPAARKSGYVTFAVTQVVVIGAMLSPWVIRNYLVLGSPVWGRSNLGMELNLSNNDMASPLWEENDSGFKRYHPFINGSEAQLVGALGEVEYNRRYLVQAREWMLSHPAKVFTLTAKRVWYYWFQPMKTRVQTAGMAIATLLGFLGLFFAWSRANLGFRFFLLLWLVFPMPLYLFQQSTRLRYPIEWSTFLMAAYACYCITINLARTPNPRAV